MARLSENVWVQNYGDLVLNVLSEDATGPLVPQGFKPGFTHVVNPYACPEGSAGAGMQALTFHAMRKAGIAYEALYPGEASVRFAAVAHDEDMAFASSHFSQTARIERSAMDVGDFKIARKLPLLFDVLDQGRKLARAEDFLIFTNVDICPTLGFYDAMAALIGLGYDAIVINRRTVDSYPFHPALAPVMAASIGNFHHGFDCFVFPASMLDGFIMGTAIIGQGGVARPLLYNMVARARRMIMLKDVHLTYHLGDDRNWNGQDNLDYVAHNITEAMQVIVQTDDIGYGRLRDFCLNHPECFGHQIAFPPRGGGTFPVSTGT